MKFFGKGTRSRVIEDREERLDMLRKYFQHHVKNKYDTLSTPVHVSRTGLSPYQDRYL